jgi:hypothetical protein
MTEHQYPEAAETAGCNECMEDCSHKISELIACLVFKVNDLKQDRDVLRERFAKQNTNDDELMSKVRGYANAEHSLTVDMEDGTGRTGMYIETGFLRNLLKELDSLSIQVAQRQAPAITKMRHKELLTLSEECNTLKKAAEHEKKRRIEYQNIVYKVCDILDKALGRSISMGTQTLSLEVTAAVKEIVDRTRAAEQTATLLQERLPFEMENRDKIEFIRCDKGHGRLMATNWIDHGCLVCEIESLQLAPPTELPHAVEFISRSPDYIHDALDEAIRSIGAKDAYGYLKQVVDWAVDTFNPAAKTDFKTKVNAWCTKQFTRHNHGDKAVLGLLAELKGLIADN